MKFIQLDDDESSQIEKAVRLLNKNGYKSSVIQFESGIEKIVEDRIKHLEKNLSQLEDNYQQLTRRVRGFFRMELPSGKLSLVDHFLTELSGYSLDEWENNPNYITEIIHPDFLEYYQKQYQSFLEGQVPNILEYKIIRADGEERWWLQFSIGAFNSDGKLLSISAVIIDNTESKKREIKYSNLCENVTAGIFVVNMETGRIKEANRKIIETLGYSSLEELTETTKTIDHYYRVSDREIIYQLLVNDGTIIDYELPMRHKEGHPIWISLSAKLYPKEGRIEGIAIDISKRIETEKQLRESEALFRSLAEQSVAGIVLIHKDKIVFANEVIAKHSGFSIDEIIGLDSTDFLALVHEDDRLFFSEQMHKAEVTGSVSEYYSRIISKTGDTIWVSMQMNKFDYQNSTVLAATIVEVTKRVELEQKLREERDFAQKYFDIASVLLLVLDVNQNVVQINDYGCKLLGYPKDEIIGKNWFDNFIPERLRPTMKSVFSKILAEEMTPKDYYENYVITKTGEERLVSWHNTLMKNDAGGIESIISSGEDITQWRLAEEILLNRDLDINKKLRKK